MSDAGARWLHRVLAVSAVSLLPLPGCGRVGPERIAGCYTFRWAGTGPTFNGGGVPVDSVQLTLEPVGPGGGAWLVQSGQVQPDTLIWWVFDFASPRTSWHWYTYFPERTWRMPARDSFEIVLQQGVFSTRIAGRRDRSGLAGTGVFRRPPDPRNPASISAPFTAVPYECPKRLPSTTAEAAALRLLVTDVREQARRAHADSGRLRLVFGDEQSDVVPGLHYLSASGPFRSAGGYRGSTARLIRTPAEWARVVGDWAPRTRMEAQGACDELVEATRKDVLPRRVWAAANALFGRNRRPPLAHPLESGQEPNGDWLAQVAVLQPDSPAYFIRYQCRFGRGHAGIAARLAPLDSVRVLHPETWRTP